MGGSLAIHHLDDRNEEIIGLDCNLDTLLCVGKGFAACVRALNDPMTDDHNDRMGYSLPCWRRNSVMPSIGEPGRLGFATSSELSSVAAQLRGRYLNVLNARSLPQKKPPGFYHSRQPKGKKDRDHPS